MAFIHPQSYASRSGYFASYIDGVYYVCVILSTKFLKLPVNQTILYCNRHHHINNNALQKISGEYIAESICMHEMLYKNGHSNHMKVNMYLQIVVPENILHMD